MKYKNSEVTFDMFDITERKTSKMILLILISLSLIGCGANKPDSRNPGSLAENGRLSSALESITKEPYSRVAIKDVEAVSTTVRESEPDQEADVPKVSNSDLGEIPRYKGEISQVVKLPEEPEIDPNVVRVITQEENETSILENTVEESPLPDMDDLALESGDSLDEPATPNFVEVVSNAGTGNAEDVVTRSTSSTVAEEKPTTPKNSPPPPARPLAATTLAREKLRTFQLLRQYESFSSTAYWDVDAWRVGYGQDTILESRVFPGMRVSRSTAEKAMASRWSRWERPALIQQVGAGTFASLNADQRAVLTSLKWNYGKVPSRVVRAVRRGDCQGVADSIYTLRWHDRGINAWRRKSESKIFRQSCNSDYPRA